MNLDRVVERERSAWITASLGHPRREFPTLATVRARGWACPPGLIAKYACVDSGLTGAWESNRGTFEPWRSCRERLRGAARPDRETARGRLRKCR